MPLATPVCVCGTASTMRFDMAANARPKASPRTVDSMRSCQTWSCATTIPRVPSDVRVAPATSIALEPYRAARRPEARPATNVATVCGSSISPDWVTEAPKP